MELPDLGSNARSEKITARSPHVKDGLEAPPKSRYAPSATVGIVQQNRCEVECDFAICLVQSLASRDYRKTHGAHVWASLGLVVLDESHHFAARVFFSAVSQLPCRYTLALTATPHRKDGLTKLLHYLVGPTLYAAERPEEVVEVEVLAYDFAERHKELLDRNGRPLFAQMLNRLAADNQRTQIAATHSLRLLRSSERKMIVLSDRICQLEAFEHCLARSGFAEVGYYIGKSTQKEREASEKQRVILSTYSMAREAVDIPRLDTLLLLTPVGDVEQAVGRIVRDHADKAVPLVLDVLDPFSLYAHMYQKRKRFYAKHKYSVRTRAMSEIENGDFVSQPGS